MLLDSGMRQKEKKKKNTIGEKNKGQIEDKKAMQQKR